MTSHSNAPAGHHDTKQFGAIRITGTERVNFLQGQLSNDLRLLAPDKPLLAGWATAQGRLICTAWVVDWQEAIWLLLPEELVDVVVKRLRMFVLRSDVRIEAAVNRPYPVVEAAGETEHKVENNTLYTCFYDDNSFTLRIKNIATMGLQLSTSSTAEPGVATQTQWQLQLIRAGIPTIWASTSGEFVPQMVNLDLLGGISFSKGCYVGQEIVARTQNLGRIKRRMFAYSVHTSGDVTAGDTVYGVTGAAGQIVNCVRNPEQSIELLAVIKLDCVGQTLSLTPEGRDVLIPMALPYSLPEYTPGN